MTNFARTGRIRAWLAAHPTAADALLAIAVCALSIGSANSYLFGGHAPGLLFDLDSPAVDMLWTFPLMVPVAFRRSHPRAAALAFVGIAFAQLIAGPVMVTGDPFALLVLYSALLYGDAADTRRYLALAGAMGTLAGAAITLSSNAGSLVSALRNGVESQHSPGCVTLYTAGLTGDCAQSLLTEGMVTIGVIWMLLASVAIVAFWNRARRATILVMQERNAALEAGEAEERRIAALAERARIARDMHDVVAHTLSIIIVQSDGGRYAGAHDPAVARSTMETIRHESERALHDMKRLLGVFGGSAHADWNDVPALVETADAALNTASNGSVRRRVTGTPQPDRLSAQASMAAYRLVQEALTNARKYAGPGVHVTVDERWLDAGLHLTVTDDGRGAAAATDGHKPGYGLIGMRERVTAVGGTVSAGPKADGGYEVGAWIPFGAEGGAEPDTGRSADGDDGPKSPVLPIHVPVIPVPVTARVQDAMAALRSRPFAGDGDGESRYEGSNIVERLSRWTERHYLLVDSIVALALCELNLRTGILGYDVLSGLEPPNVVAALAVMAMTLPLAFRRRFPESSAAVVAVAAALQLVFLPHILAVNLFALCSLYSAIVYGRETSWRWLSAAAAADCLLAGVSMAAQTNGYGTPIGMAAQLVMGYSSVRSIVATALAGVGYGVVVAVMCMGAVALGRWTRSRGSNALVLQMREDALRAEQAKQKVLAANMERDRIGAAIRAEVTATLTAVIDRADAGIAMLDEADRHGAAPSPEEIAGAFQAIGKQGRTALAHMRQLLAVLRETGSTDEAHRDGIDAMKLRPNAPIDEQMARAQGGSGDAAAGAAPGGGAETR